MAPNTSKEETIEVRQAQDKEKLLEQLKKMPIVQVACERAGVGRTTYYRFLKSDDEFRRTAAEAMREGETIITEMAETQLISLMKDKHFPSIALWLRQHHPKYANRLEITARMQQEPEQLTSEQEMIVQEALRLAVFDPRVAPEAPREHEIK